MNGSKVVKFDNKVIGEYYLEIDGYWVFNPNIKGGYWDEHILIKVLYELRVLNAAWDLQIMSDPKVSNLGQGLVFDEEEAAHKRARESIVLKNGRKLKERAQNTPYLEKMLEDKS